MIMNGKIKSKELYNGLKKFINNENLESDCEEIFKKLDMDNSGYIQYIYYYPYQYF